MAKAKPLSWRSFVAVAAIFAQLVFAQRQVITYHSHPYDPATNETISMLPLIDPTTGGYITNVITATWFVQKDHRLTFGDENPPDSRFDVLRDEILKVQAVGVKVTMMLLGNWTMLDGNDTHFEQSYSGIYDAIKLYNFDGIDLDVEDINGYPVDRDVWIPQAIGYAGITRMIERLSADFGPDFLITMAPVASALWGGRTLSNFSYIQLEAEYGDMIDWYNGQFYNGWGYPGSAADYKKIIDAGFPAEKVIMGLATSRSTGGFVDQDQVAGIVGELLDSTGIGGISGWDYWDGLPGGRAAPWEWVQWAGKALRNCKARYKRAMKRV